MTVTGPPRSRRLHGTAHEEHLRVGHPPSAAPDRAVRGAAVHGAGVLRAAAGHGRPRHLLPRGHGDHRAAGRRAAGARDPGPAEGRRRRSPASAISTTSPPGRSRARRSSSCSSSIGTPVDRAVADVRDAVAKVRVQLPQGIQEPVVQRVNADGGPMEYYAVSSQLAHRGGAVLVRRQHHHQAAAQCYGRGAGAARRRRQPRDPRRARPGAHAGARHHGRRGQRAAAHAQPRLRRRPRAARRRRAVDPRARRRAHRAALGDTQIMLPGGRFARLADLAEVRDGVGEIRCDRAPQRPRRRPPSAWPRPRAPPTSAC